MSELNQKKVEAFTKTMIDMLNGGMLTLMTSIGSRTGLFEVMAGLPASTSEQIAQAAGLNERYVREWLNTMVTGRIVEYEPVGSTYILPPEHAALITSQAGPDNMAVLARIIPILAGVEDGIVSSFSTGGGIFYDQFTDFMDVWAGVNQLRLDRVLLPKIMPLLSDLADPLGIGIDVLEIGCGDGYSTNLLAKAYPNSRFTGYDIRDEALNEGRRKSAEMGSSNLRFASMDLVSMDEANTYDLVLAFDVIHDQAQPRTVLKNVASALKPNGTFMMVDIKASSQVHENIDHIMGPFLYTTSTMHCMTVSLSQGGEGLGTMWGEQKALELLDEAGFKNVAIKQVDGDIFNNYYIAKKN